MTKKERIFRHIEDNGNAMRYTDIIKFAYEDKNGKGTFDKKKNRGFYSSAFRYNIQTNWDHVNPDGSTGRIVKRWDWPIGHFVTRTKNGNLFKLDGLWSVHRPLNWNSNDERCDNYEIRIEKFLNDGKTVVKRDIVSYLKPYANQYRKIGYDWGSTNNLLRKMINSGKVYRVWCINDKTGRFAYHYGLVDIAIESTTSQELNNKLEEYNMTKDINNNMVVPQEEYDNMCSLLAKYNISAYTLDELANKHLQEGKSDVGGAYHSAFYDLLPGTDPLEESCNELKKEIGNLSDLMIAEDNPQIKDQKYVVICLDDNYHQGIFITSELQEFFMDKDPKNYIIIEAGNMITLEKKITTTFIIK